MGLFGGGHRTGKAVMDPRLKQQQDILDAEQAKASGYGDQAAGAGIAGMLNFDPTDAIKTYADAQWSGAQEGLKKTLGNLAGAAAGSGRLDTGFFDEDRGQVIRDVANDYTRNVASTAVTAAGMRQNNNQALASSGMGYNEMSADLASGAFDRRQAEINQAAAQKAADRASKRNAWGSVVGGVVGMVNPSSISKYLR